MHEPAPAAARDGSPLRRAVAVLGRGWRLVGTALSFAVFGAGGVILGVLVIPLACLLTPAHRRRRVARRLVTGAFAAFVGLMRAVRVLDYRIEGLDRVRDLSRCLIVANHPSLIDVVFLLAIFRQADCVVKGAHWSNPFTMGPIRWAGYISNADPECLIETAVARLEDGGHVLMFPEGTRTVPGEPLAFRRGAATIAVNARATVLPVLLRCTPTTLTKAEPWYHIPRRRVLFEAIVLEPIPAADVLDGKRTSRQAAIALTERLAAYYGGLLGSVPGDQGTESPGRGRRLAIPDQQE